MIAAGPLLSPWFAFPFAAITMLIIAIHATALSGRQMPESRRTIRKINAMLMLLGVPLIAYAFSGVGSDRPKEFVLVWAASAIMLTIIVLFAMVDILNTARLHRAERLQLRKRVRQARSQLVLAAHEARRRNVRTDGKNRPEPAD